MNDRRKGVNANEFNRKMDIVLIIICLIAIGVFFVSTAKVTTEPKPAMNKSVYDDHSHKTVKRILANNNSIYL